MSLVFFYGEDEFLVYRAALDYVEKSLTSRLVYKQSFEHEDLLNDFNNHRISYIYRDVTVSINKEMVSSPNDFIFLEQPKQQIDGARYLEIPSLKVNDKVNEIIPWIINEGKRHNIDLSNVAGALFLNSGIRLRKLASEIEKISELNINGPIGLDQIKDILVFSNALTPKDILRAIKNGNTKSAISLYEKLQRDDFRETGWILAFLQNEFLQYRKVGLLSGASDSEISSRLGVNEYVFKNFIRPGSDIWSDDFIKAVVPLLRDIEISHKLGRGIPEVSLFLIMIHLSEEAKNGKRQSA